MRRLELLLRAPIVRGALRGRWWLPTGGGKVWRVLGGSYEAAETAVFSRLVGPGDVVFDLGAHIGYYTLLASSLVGAGGRVFAFEPHPVNAWYLRHHARMNGCANVEVLETAVYDRSGDVRFEAGTGTGTGHVAPDGELRVRSVRLDDFVAERGVSPAAVKIDVEGAECAVLEGARQVLRSSRPMLFLSTHHPEVRVACERILAGLDYRTEPLNGGGPLNGDLLCVPQERARSTAPTSASLHFA